MGKLIFRSTFMDQKNKAQVVAINAPNIGLKYLKYLLEYDSVHGRFPGTIEVEHEACGLVVDGEFVRVFHTRNPAKLKWGDVGVDYVIDRNSV
jgi:glyceraldehyde 3-phosphate dehydrogenase